MKIIKRNGTEVEYDVAKIEKAISKAAKEDLEEYKRIMDGEFLVEIVKIIDKKIWSFNRAVSVEEIQDMVEEELMEFTFYKTARNYIKYRYKRELVRKGNTTDDELQSLLNYTNENIKQENSNKNPIRNSTQRDYMAGEVSKDLSKRFLLPQDVIDAHEKGLLHFHDMDYFAQHMHNCCLINLEDMLQNGTVISGTAIEKPKSFSTACNIATQIIAQVASSQYGGQSISLSHLAPFVDISRQKIKKEVESEFDLILNSVGESQDLQHEELIKEIVEKRVHAEIKKGVQTIQYQIVTLLTTNGQAPFLTVFMYLNEVKDEQTKHDLALIIAETLKQRKQGVKNEKGVWITPAFPKLIYVLQEDNIKEGTEYYWLTKLAAECTAKRLVPDYISEKIMKQLKVDNKGEGQCYPAMGCRSFLTVWRDEEDKPKYYGRLTISQ